MKHVGSIALALGLLPFSAVGVAQDFAKAKQEGRVVFYTSWGPSDADYVIKGFERKYPFLKVDPVRSSSERTLNRLLTEQRANSFLGDVVAISGIQSGILKEKGALDRYESREPLTFPQNGRILTDSASAFIRPSTCSAITRNWCRPMPFPRDMRIYSILDGRDSWAGIRKSIICSALS